MVLLLNTDQCIVLASQGSSPDWLRGFLSADLGLTGMILEPKVLTQYSLWR